MGDRPRILIIEDEAGLVMTLTDRLEAEGYACDSASEGQGGFELARRGDYDALILDVMLPGKGGFDICRDLRAAGLATPILMLTAKSDVIDRVLGLKLGADDYLCKPFESAELLARLEALLRRSARRPADPVSDASHGGRSLGRVEYEGFGIDFTRGLVSREGAEISLSAQEYKLLAYFAAHPGEIVTRNHLLDAVWGYGAEVSSRTVDVHVAWLRQKIGDSGPCPRHILTVRGLGYRFMP